jgi:predicted RNA-binding protein (virulence factor B family)
MKLGITQTLKVVRSTDNGVYLADLYENRAEDGDIDQADVLLPKNQAKGLELNQRVDVFIYKDSEDRPVATTASPLISLGQVAVLKCKEVTKIGAFLDWGLSKDLLLPFREQTKKVEKGEDVLVALYTYKSNRLCATMKVYHYLKKNSPYKLEDKVTGTVYEVSGNFGTFVAVDDIYSALIPKKELFHPIPIGAKITARVVKVLDDGKLTLSCREKSFIQMDADARLIMYSLKSAGGFLPFHDKSSPDEIKERFGLSKAAFKRAIGALYKSGNITISENGIKLTEE